MGVDGEGQVDGDGEVGRMEWMDGWREMLALTRADNRRERASRQRRGRAGERAALGLQRRRRCVAASQSQTRVTRAVPGCI